MPTDAPQDRIRNEWYDFTPNYSGSASILFDGEAPIEGDGTFTFSESGESKIEFECRDAEHSARLDGILQGGQPGVILPGGPPRTRSITVVTSGGTFDADYRVFSTGHSMTLGAARNSSATFRAIGATFNARDASPPTCFALPLYNMLSPSFVTYPRAQPPEIAYHPLRIFPTPAGNPDPHTDEEGFRNVNWHNQLVTFQIDGLVGFIEPLPDYRERARQLRDGDVQSHVTAVLVCNAVGRDCRADAPETWFPVDLLNLLSLATGQRVGAPWIEYRAGDGALVRRVHREFGRPSFNPGHRCLPKSKSRTPATSLPRDSSIQTLAA